MPSIEGSIASTETRLSDAEDATTALDTDLSTVKSALGVLSFLLCCAVAPHSAARARHMASFSFLFLSTGAFVLGGRKSNPGLTCGHIFANQGYQNLYGDGAWPGLPL